MIYIASFSIAGGLTAYFDPGKLGMILRPVVFFDALGAIAAYGVAPNEKIYTNYTEPQRKYLEGLTKHRNIMWKTYPGLNPKKNPKAKPLTLTDFENFVKYANDIKK